MQRRIEKVAVLGAGTMGARISAHLANAGVPSYLFDIVPPDADGPMRNRIAAAGLEAAVKSKPAAFFKPSLERLVTVGNFEDDLDKLAEVDWVIEAIVEDLEIKRSLLRRVEAIRKPGTIVTTNTSGLPVAKIVEGFPDDFRRSLVWHPLLQSAALHAPAGADSHCPKPTPSCWRLSRTSATCIWAKAWCTPRTRPTSSPIASAPSPR